MGITAAVAALTLLAPVMPLMGGDTVVVKERRCVVGFHATSSTAHMIITGQDCGTILPAPPVNQPTALLRGPSGTPIPVRSVTPVGVGGTVCKSGPVTGWTCGTVQAVNQTVHFPGGVQYGLTRTTVCSEAGEGGSPVVTPDGRAVGVVVGGTGNCATGGHTYFQPLLSILSRYGLSLYTG